jgi:protein O-GlcNAc transferase
MNDQTIDTKDIEHKFSSIKTLYDEAQTELMTFQRINNEKYIECIRQSELLISFLNNLMPHQLSRYADIVKVVYYIGADLLLKTLSNTNILHCNENDKRILEKAAIYLQKSLSMDPYYKQSIQLYETIIQFLVLLGGNINDNINLMETVLLYNPSNYQLHYNLGILYQNLNNISKSISHNKLAIEIVDLLLHDGNCTNVDELKQFKVKCFNELGRTYFALQDQHLSIFFFSQGLNVLPDDPDLNNQIGVIYTHLRYTDKAIHYFKRGIENYTKACISVGDSDTLLATLYMNMGVAYCCEINYEKAIECYDKSMSYKIIPNALQNKLMDCNYISNTFEDPMYITNLHKTINNIFPNIVNICKNYVPNPQFIGSFPYTSRTTKLNIGFIGGDFINHPVSYFISSILKTINTDAFNIYCYSSKFVDLKGAFPKCNWNIINKLSAENVYTLIRSHNIDILFDLSGHTNDNRLDVLVMKPAPIQISYCGYPNTSGLFNMDYRITDYYTDSNGKIAGPGNVVRPSTQKYYTEKLVFLSRTFLNYTPPVNINTLPIIVNADDQPAIRNQYLTIGSFNRYNKINTHVVAIWRDILRECPDVRLVVKTKEFTTNYIREAFLSLWDSEMLQRITILGFKDVYQEHLVDYNLIDIALDSFPYSGTTTSCEAMMMGVPVLTLFDSERQYHAQNVTSSIMINSDMSEFVVYSTDDYINTIKMYANNLSKLRGLKINTRENFINSPVFTNADTTTKSEFVEEFEQILLTIYANHRWPAAK